MCSGRVLVQRVEDENTRTRRGGREGARNGRFRKPARLERDQSGKERFESIHPSSPTQSNLNPRNLTSGRRFPRRGFSTPSFSFPPCGGSCPLWHGTGEIIGGGEAGSANHKPPVRCGHWTLERQPGAGASSRCFAWKPSRGPKFAAWQVRVTAKTTSIRPRVGLTIPAPAKRTARKEHDRFFASPSPSPSPISSIRSAHSFHAEHSIQHSTHMDLVPSPMDLGFPFQTAHPRRLVIMLSSPLLPHGTLHYIRRIATPAPSLLSSYCSAS